MLRRWKKEIYEKEEEGGKKEEEEEKEKEKILPSAKEDSFNCWAKPGLLALTLPRQTPRGGSYETRTSVLHPLGSPAWNSSLGI